MSGEGRGAAARIGIAALNLLAPGLGLMRVQRLRAALAFLLAPFAILVAVLLVYAATPVLAFRAWVALVAVSLLALLMLYAGSIALSWRASRGPAAAGPWWSRWHGLVAALALVMALNWPASELVRGFYRAFYLPAESMMPTLALGDRLVARMRPPPQLRRGAIVLVRAGRAFYIKRLAALAGDRIAMRDGIVVLNGRPVPQRYLRSERLESPGMGMPAEARRLAEQFPGEAAAHEIYDTGPFPHDDMAEQVVAPGHIFVLGDHRDRSADSRVPRADMGLEQVPVGDVAGVAQFIYWSADRRRVGTRLGD
jgi:signal peptidase I